MTQSTEADETMTAALAADGETRTMSEIPNPAELEARRRAAAASAAAVSEVGAVKDAERERVRQVRRRRRARRGARLRSHLDEEALAGLARLARPESGEVSS